MQKVIDYIKFRLDEANNGDYWFETSHYLYWKPVRKEGTYVLFGFIVVATWIVVSDLAMQSFTTAAVALPSLFCIYFVLCFVKGRKV